MLFDLIDLSKLRRAVIYALLMLVLFAVQDLLVARITIQGVHALFIPAAVIAVGLFDGGLWGGFLGLAVGFFADMGYPEHVCMFTVLFAAAGFFAGVLGKYLLHKGFFSYITLFILMLAVITFCQMFRFLFFTDTDSRAVLRTGLIQLLWSIPWAVPVYFPCKSIADRPLTLR